MPQRTRIKTEPMARSYYNTTQGWVNTYPEYLKEFFFESSVPGSNNCIHYALKGGQGKVSYNSAPESGSSNSPGGLHSFSSYPEPWWSPGSGMSASSTFTSIMGRYPKLGLNRKKLLTTSDYGLLQAIAEFDDTLMIFKKKFWRSLSYGSISWGLLPFVSEVTALLSQAKNLALRMENNRQEYEDEESILDSFEYVTTSGHDKFVSQIDVEIIQRYSGEITIPFNFFLEAFDRLGFHPDILTAWDLVPLSFMVDWFLPVGALLESFTNRGWINKVLFNGWYTAKCRSYIYPKYRSNDQFAAKQMTASGAWHLSGFTRFKIEYMLETGVGRDPNLDLKIPSITQLFNTLYLLVLSKRK